MRRLDPYIELRRNSFRPEKIDPKIDTDNSNYINILKNISPEFFNENDFNLSETSPAIDIGRETSITLDILGNFRSEADLGSYEFVE